MNDVLVIKIVFGILLSVGSLALFLIAFLLFYKYLVQEKRCTSKVKGVIKKYTLASRGGENSSIHLPVVYYVVNGKEYKVVGPEYKAYKTITKTSLSNKNDMEYEENNQVLKINRTVNSVFSTFSNPIEELYPINSEIDVYYDSNNPKLAYVLRYCNKKWLFYLTFCAGLLTLMIDLYTLFIL